MDHAPTSLNTKLLAATILGAVVLLGAVGALYQHAEKQIGTEFLKQHQTTTELAGKLADLDTRLSALTSAPPPAADTTVTDQLRQDLTAAQTTITHFRARKKASHNPRRSAR